MFWPGLCLDLGREDDAVVVAGAGRSGTSWICDVLNCRNEFRYIFEPLHPSVRALSVFRHAYLPPDKRDPDRLRLMGDVLAGRFHNGWSDRLNRRRVAFRRLVKFIRANLLLPWIKANFPAVPIVLVLRHPCAVAVSRMNLGAEWTTSLDVVLSDETLVKDHLQPFVEHMKGTRDEFERQIYFWCVQNYVPLRQLSRREMHVVFYELLCTDPNRAMQDLFSWLGREVPPEASAQLRMPSGTSRQDSAVVLGKNLVEGWTEQIHAGQLDAAVGILKIFGLDRIYGSGPLPDVAAWETGSAQRS